ncbi:MAG: queuosine precursor transporter, partial [Thiobacillus sp.]
VLGSLTAFFVGEFVNSYIMAKMKVRMNGKRLWMRTIGSTVVGQAFDSMLFTVLAFGGLWPWSTILSVIMWNYVVKVAIEALATPLTYLVINHLKSAESEDHYDRYTDFNPFSLAEN